MSIGLMLQTSVVLPWIAMLLLRLLMMKILTSTISSILHILVVLQLETLLHLLKEFNKLINNENSWPPTAFYVPKFMNSFKKKKNNVILSSMKNINPSSTMNSSLTSSLSNSNKIFVMKFKMKLKNVVNFKNKEEVVLVIRKDPEQVTLLLDLHPLPSVLVLFSVSSNPVVVMLSRFMNQALALVVYSSWIVTASQFVKSFSTSNLLVKLCSSTRRNSLRLLFSPKQIRELEIVLLVIFFPLR